MMHCKRSLFIAILLLLTACQPTEAEPLRVIGDAVSQSQISTDNAEIVAAFQAKKSDIQVTGRGIVSKSLKDDNKGSRHQKFLVTINPQQTLLVAHNIDLAARVPLAVGDEISFYGEYVYNPKGGIIHWTHHAPHHDHVAGWILHRGIQYQ
jgi:hypothetical protein